MSEVQHDYPFDDVVKKARRLLREHPNLLIHQKFTCAGCGERLGMSEANTFYESGTCDKCGAITNIRERGCNFLMHVRFNDDRTDMG